MNKNNIAVAGTGYVGLSVAALLAQNNHVMAVDVVPEKELDLTATTDGAAAYRDAEMPDIANRP